MQLLSNKGDKDDTNVITVTKKIGELQFEDEEEDSFFTKVKLLVKYVCIAFLVNDIFLKLIIHNPKHKPYFSIY